MNDRAAVVITGASTGIGEATALRLATGGFQVFAGVRNDSDGERLSSQSLPGLTALRIDVAKPESIAAAVQAVLGRMPDRV